MLSLASVENVWRQTCVYAKLDIEADFATPSVPLVPMAKGQYASHLSTVVTLVKGSPFKGVSDLSTKVFVQSFFSFFFQTFILYFNSATSLI